MKNPQTFRIHNEMFGIFHLSRGKSWQSRFTVLNLLLIALNSRLLQKQTQYSKTKKTRNFKQIPSYIRLFRVFNLQTSFLTSFLKSNSRLVTRRKQIFQSLVMLLKSTCSTNLEREILGTLLDQKAQYKNIKILRLSINDRVK